MYSHSQSRNLMYIVSNVQIHPILCYRDGLVKCQSSVPCWNLDIQEADLKQHHILERWQTRSSWDPYNERVNMLDVVSQVS